MFNQLAVAVHQCSLALESFQKPRFPAVFWDAICSCTIAISYSYILLFIKCKLMTSVQTGRLGLGWKVYGCQAFEASLLRKCCRLLGTVEYFLNCILINSWYQAHHFHLLLALYEVHKKRSSADRFDSWKIFSSSLFPYSPVLICRHQALESWFLSSDFQARFGYPWALREEAGESQQLIHGAQCYYAAAGGPWEGAHKVCICGQNGVPHTWQFAHKPTPHFWNT